MEKTITTKNKRLETDTPNDLVVSILSKLPPKSLKRFGCICKSWALLFENPYFINTHRNNFISNDLDVSFLLNLVDFDPPRNVLYSLSGERFKNKVKLNWPNPFQEETLFNIFSSGSVDGILCLHQFHKKVVLWNPTTGEHRVIPSSPIEWYLPPSTNNFYVGCKIYGFGYDCVRDDYKVIRCVTFLDFSDSDSNSDSDNDYVPLEDISLEPLWEIYSLRCNSWKKLDVEMPPFVPIKESSRVYMEGVSHWFSRDRYEYETYLVSFDLSNEVFSTTSIPSNIYVRYDDRLACIDPHMVVLNWSIAFISYHPQKTTFHISILGELGVKESLTKLFTVDSSTCVGHPIGVGNHGQIFFKTKDERLTCFDLSTMMVEELDVTVGRFLSHIVVYKKSLLSIGEIGN